MVKNRNNCLPLNKNNTIYIPMRHVPESTNFWGQKTPAKWERPISIATAKRYFNITYDPGEADAAIVVINSPDNGPTQGYSKEDKENGGNGFIPVSLQYGEYTALDARETSIAGDRRETDVLNRSYRGKTAIVNNNTDLKLIMDVRALMKDKPVIVVIRMSNPTIVKEFEKDIDALLINFDVQDQAILDIISGNTEPSALLPFQMPADMTTVEKQAEDLPFDMVVHVDSEGNRYDFGFGMNWKGVIKDKRTERYSIKHN
jgi:beta-glucosidase